MTTLIQEKSDFAIGDRVERINENYNQQIRIGAIGTVVNLLGKEQLQVCYDPGENCANGQTICTYRENHKVILKANAQHQKETPDMSLKITTSHTVGGKETKTLSASEQASLIDAQQKKITALQDVYPQTNKIKKAINELQTELNTFVEHLDSLPE